MRPTPSLLGPCFNSLHSSHTPALIGYWIAPFCAVVLTEHVLFRRSFSTYDVANAWDDPHHTNLPRPYAALCALAASIGVIVLSMQQAWWTGPVAKRGTGDLGMILGFVVSVAVYAVARWIELHWGSKASEKRIQLAERKADDAKA